MSNIIIYDTYNVNVTIEDGEVIGVQVVEGFIHDVIAGTNITIDKSDPLNPVISSTVTLTNGSGTTANGTAVDLGGTLTSDMTISRANNTETNSLFISDSFANLSTAYDATTNAAVTLTSQAGNVSSASILNAFSSKVFGFEAASDRTGPAINATHNSNNSLDVGLLLRRSDSSPAVGIGTSIEYDLGLTPKSYIDLVYTNVTGSSEQSEFRFRPIVSGSNTTRLILGQNVTLNLGSDATGDIYYRNSSGYLTRLAAGTDTHVLTLSGGLPSWAAPSGGGLTVGTSTITSGTNTRVLYNNSGVLGEYTVSGSGNVAMTTSPTFTTPDIGTATGTASGDWHLTGTSTLTGASTVVGTSSNTNTFQYASLATSTTPVFTLENPTAAAAGAQQFSPFIRQRARGWKTNATAASQTVDFDFGVTPVQGAAAPTGYWSLWSSINGGTQSENVRFRSDGAMFLTGGSGFGANLFFGTSGDAYIGRGTSGTQGINIFGALSTANIYTLSVSPSVSYTYTSGTGGMLSLAGGFSPSSGSGIFYGNNQTGTINMTGTSSGNVFGYGVNQTVTAAKGDYTGFYHNPTITSVTGVHYSFRATSGLMALNASVAGSSSFRIPHGTAPSSPVDGDIWTTTAGLYVRINGATVGPLT